MRIRYQIVGEPLQVKCDMPNATAKKLFNDLKTDGLCEWAELVGEEDNNYMEIVDSFENKHARTIKDLFGGLAKSKY